MRSEPENSASNRGRLVDCTEGARQPTDFRRHPPPCSPAKALHPVPIRHWKIPDRLAQTARRCREGAEQRTPTARVTTVQWQQTTGLWVSSACTMRRSWHPGPEGPLKPGAPTSCRMSLSVPHQTTSRIPSLKSCAATIWRGQLRRIFFPNPGT